MKKMIALLCLGFATVGSAHAASINVLGGFTSSSYSTNATGVNYTPQNGLTFGATAEFEMIPMLLSMEAGVLSVGKKIKQENAPAFENSWRALEVPVLVRFTALPFVDFGAGVFWQSYGDYTQKFTASGTETTGNKWASAGFDDSDFGLKLSARARLPIAPLMGLLLDVSYNKGLKELSTESPDVYSYKSTAVNVLAGLSIGF